MRNPVLVATAYFVDAVGARLKQDFELRREKKVLTSHQKNCSRPPTGLMRCLSLRQTD